MLKTMIGAGAICFSVVAASQDADFASDAELLIGAFSEIHPGYERYATAEQLESAAEALRSAAAANPDEGAFYVAVQRYLATIQCEHTEAELPPALQERLAGSMFPVDFEYVPDENGVYRAIVVAVAEGASEIVAGDEIVSIDGRPVAEIFEAVSPLISVDGFTDHTRTHLFGGSDDIGLTTFDILYPLVFGERDEYALVVASADGSRRSVTLGAVEESASLAMRGISGWKNFSDEGAVRWEMLDDRSAGLWVNTFVNYRTPVDAEQVFAKVFAEINASGADRLVLDFREVGGGSGDVQSALLRHLITRPIRVGGPTWVRTYEFDAYREHLRTWAQGAFDMPAALFTPEGDLFRVSEQVAGGVETLEPAAQAWQGELVVLTGPTNESGATMMLSELRPQREVTYIGEPTGGNAEGPTAGIIAFLTLPDSGIVARLPLLRSRTSAQSFEPGMGISPDVEVTRTFESVREGRDEAMERAVSR